MKWRVEKAGIGGGTYDDIRLAEGGALECRNRFDRNNSVGYAFEVVAYYGPGMWVSAQRVQEAK